MREVLKRPTPIKAHRRNKAVSMILWFFATLLILFVGLGILSHLPSVNIREVDTQGLQVLDKEEVNQSVINYLSGNNALFYSRGNIFIYSKNNITKLIKDKFPRVYSVNSIERVKNKLIINLEERQAVVTWCGKDLPNYENRFEEKDCYFVDQEGFIFGQAPFFTPGVYLTIYGGIKPDTDIIGQTVLIKNSIIDYIDLVNDLDEYNLPISSLFIGDDGQDAMLLNIPSKSGSFAKILFNEAINLKEILVKVDSTINEETFAKQYKANSEHLEYIDTRFDNRVFYKFQE
jgi:hypothetical protein